MTADKHKIKIKGIKKEIKLTHLSDFHLRVVYGKKDVERLVNLILKEKGDLIVPIIPLKLPEEIQKIYLSYKTENKFPNKVKKKIEEF